MKKIHPSKYTDKQWKRKYREYLRLCKKAPWKIDDKNIVTFDEFKRCVLNPNVNTDLSEEPFVFKRKYSGWCWCRRFHSCGRETPGGYSCGHKDCYPEWPTLEGRLSQPLTTEKEAVEQLAKIGGVELSKRAKKILNKK